MRFYSLFLTLLFAFNCTPAVAESTLLKLAKLASGDSAQIFFTFDKLPSYYHTVSGKRIDVIFQDTSKPDALTLPPLDDKIIKILSGSHKGMTRISFFFRYIPQKATFDITQDQKLVLEVLLGNQYSRSFQDFSSKLEGVSVLKRDSVDYTNPLISSPFANNWPSFISSYESDVKIQTPVQYTLPPFPVISEIPSKNEDYLQILPSEILELAALNLWEEIQPILLSLLNQEPSLENQKLLALTYGETLLRQKNYEGAYKQLYLLEQNYPDESVGLWASYLLIRATAEFEDAFIAEYKLTRFENRVSKTNTLAPYILLTQIELALANDQLDTMQKLLERDDIALPDNTLKIKEMRQADYAYASRKYTQAYVAYQTLNSSDLLAEHPYSLNGYCDSLYRHKRYKESASCYIKLEQHSTPENTLGLVAFRRAMAELKYIPAADLLEVFIETKETYRETEAGIRSALKETDLRFMADTNWAEQAAKRYHELAQNAVRRDLVEEALFKEALMYTILQQPDKSIPILMKLNRDFHTGNLQFTSEALLLKILPGVIQRLIQENNYLAALSLAKQNKKYFQKNWIDNDVFIDIAKAYQEAGLFREAENTYLYLLETVDIDAKEQFFLPLIQNIYDQGNYEIVDNYASQYQYLYPNGIHRTEILDLRLHALVLLGKYSDALTLLADPLPDDDATQILVATINFYTNNYSKARDILLNITENSQLLPQRERFILAECLYQTGQLEEAEKLFLTLESTDYHTEQALYRLAQIEQNRGNKEKSLKFYQKIVETEGDSLWKEYAERELEFRTIIEQLRY